MNLKGAVALLVGTLCILGAIFDWQWFMNDRKVRFFTSILGYQGTRVFYVLIGILMIVLGIKVLAPH